MLRNYFKTAVRNLWRHKGSSVLNIAGLAVGMSAFFLIYQYVRLETSYDNFHSKSSRIFRLVTDLESTSATQHIASTSMPMAINLKADYPDIEAVVRLNRSATLIKRGAVRFQEKATVFADSSLFTVFDFPLVEGNPGSALKAPFSVVLSQSTAKKYFGEGDPMGQTLLFSDSGFSATVTGVMKDLPGNSSIKADLFVSMSTRRRFRDSLDYRWGSFGVSSFLLLKPGADPNALQAKLRPFIQKHIGEKLKNEKQDYVLFLERLKDIYWSSRGGFVNGSRSNVNIFWVIGLFILLIACINFVNLTTARATERAKEVGIRKVIGAERMQLAGQFLGESIVLCCFAFVLSMGLCSLALPLFNQLAGKTISAGIYSEPVNILTLLAIVLVIGLLAGVYPALVLSSFKPIASLKGRFSTGRQGLVLRKGLVVVQFTISISLIIGTVVVYSELDYLRSRDLGFDKDRLLVVDTHNDPHKTVFRREVTGLPGVVSTAFSGSVPGAGTWGAYSKVENSRGEMQIANLDLTYVDFGYLEQYGMKLLAGRFFRSDIPTDTMQAMVLNEKAVRLFGYPSPAAAVGRRFEQWGKKGRIIGVIRDYNFNGLQQEVTPLSICLDFNDCNYLSLKVTGSHLPGTIAALKKKWDQLGTPLPLDYFFLDEAFNEQYKSETRFGKLFVNFAVLAIFISCLGLLGLSSYSTLQRTKEVGVRRVMGASVSGIVGLLSADFLKLVVVAFVVSVPLSWYLMEKWLRDFAYRIDISWWIFLLSGTAALFIAFLTISYQAIKAAVASPIKSLKTE
ncbi:MAG: ABC transporter permease [Bacteroidetes bacterium]|nr:ABC transporter permease [Bacteroidota bacterium]